MREKTIMPTTLLDWPRITDLLPDQKLIVMRLWCAPWLSTAGVGLMPLASEAATLSLSRAALEEALREFERRELIIYDNDTGEIFIRDWFRFHTFNNARARAILSTDIEKIRSSKIRQSVDNFAKKIVFLEKTDIYHPNSNSNVNKSKSTRARARGAAVVDEELLAELLAAAAYAATRDGVFVRSPARFRDTVASRVRESGFNATDYSNLNAYRVHLARAAADTAHDEESPPLGAQEARARAAGLRAALSGSPAPPFTGTNQCSR